MAHNPAEFERLCKLLREARSAEKSASDEYEACCKRLNLAREVAFEADKALDKYIDAQIGGVA
jgi:hypothetical protein